MSLAFVRRSLALALALAVALALVLGVGCDPVHEREVERLGGEAPGVPEGETHRPGQPCLACHGGRGPGSPTFSIAGTAYLWRGATIPAERTQVVLVDAHGTTITVTTNEVGNFFLAPHQFDPVYPVTVKLCAGPSCDESNPANTVKPMKTHIGREGGCAGCHVDPESATSPGHLYLVDPDAGAP